MNVINVQPMRVEFANAGVMKIERIAAGVGIILFHAATKTAAGMHVLRGESAGQNPPNPAYFADTGIRYILDQFKEKGVQPPYLVAVAGGASMLALSEKAKSGSAVLPVVKDLLKNNNLPVKLEETGGTKVRTIFFNIDERKMKIV